MYLRVLRLKISAVQLPWVAAKNHKTHFATSNENEFS